MRWGILLFFSLFALNRPLQAETTKPKLVVLVVFDQLRGDYLEKWKPLFGSDGFVRMLDQGAWYNNCHYPYAITTTGPGHASMLTGCSPNTHGIINNSWYDRNTSSPVYCSGSAKYVRVPMPPKEDDEDDPEAKTKSKTSEPKKATPKLQGTPDLVLVPTVADVLKENNPKSKVFGLSFKDRSAVMPTGKKADGVYWLDSADGNIVTSSYYRDSLPKWVNEFNQTRLVNKWFSKEWTHLKLYTRYEEFSGPDEVTGEGTGQRQGVSFPHPMNAGLKAPGRGYYEALFNSPFGNDFLLELVKTCVEKEELGRDENPDLLVVSFSSNDAVGHTWGPDSQEVLDTTLRSDQMMARFLKFLDEKVGKENYLIALTADHGICPLPEVSAKEGKDAKRVSFRKISSNLEAHLTKKYTPQVTDPKEAAKNRWIDNASLPWLYLNPRLLKTHNLKTEDVAKTIKEFLSHQEGIGGVWTQEDLKKPAEASDRIGQQMRRSFYPDRSGDVGVINRKYDLFDDRTPSSGTTHGAPWDYDTHVPLLVFGTGVKSGTRTERVEPQRIASIFAKALGITKPASAEYEVPAGLFIQK